MKLKQIKSVKEYNLFLEWVDMMFDQAPPGNSTEGEKLHIALLLIKEYEDKNYKIPFPDPLEAVKEKMNEKGLKNKDLVDWVGSKGYVSALLNGNKPLTLKLAKLFHQKLGIPAEVFLAK